MGNTPPKPSTEPAPMPMGLPPNPIDRERTPLEDKECEATMELMSESMRLHEMLAADDRIMQVIHNLPVPFRMTSFPRLAADDPHHAGHT